MDSISLLLERGRAKPEIKCGKKKIWLDPNETSDIGNANSRQNVRRLIKDDLHTLNPCHQALQVFGC